MEDGGANFGWQGALLLALILVPAVITALKGRYLFLVLGLILGIFWLVGAIRLAAPGSFWYRRFYGPEKRARADDRFRKRVRAEPQTPPSA